MSITASVRPVRAMSVPTVTYSPLAPTLPLRTTPGWHLARRASLAPTATLAAEITRLGPRAWINAQLAPAATDPEWDAVQRQHFGWAALTYPQLSATTGGRAWMGGPVSAHLQSARPIFTRWHLKESMVALVGDWLYAPYRSKAEPFLLDYDRDVLRRHALGRYADLLHAAVTHPAMLYSLDNDVSSKENPNENLGRELLELYTVGVGAYTEADVRQSTLMLTGHTIDWTTGTHLVDEWFHHTGRITVMGFTHANTSSRTSDVKAALRSYTDYLARHPRTAERVARRLAVRFVSDTPSASLISTLASTYTRNDTALVPVLRALFAHPEFWASVGAKWTRPFEALARAARAGKPTSYRPTEPVADNPYAMSSFFWTAYGAGHAPRDWPRVDGYPDVADAWRTTATTLAVWNAVHAMAWSWGDTFPDVAWGSALGVTAGTNVWTVARKIATDLTGYTWRDQELAPVASWLADWGSRPATATETLTAVALRDALPEAVRLVLASPYAFLR